MRTNETTAIRLLVEYLKGEGVTHVFGIPGGALAPFYEAVFELGGITPVLAKHEGGAAFMADGYARASGRLGVCCSTTGPGATNLVTGVACACADSVPLLVLTAQVSTASFGKGAFQESTCHSVDIVDMFKAVTKSSVMVPSAAKTGDIVKAALRTALSGRKGPVHINFPMDLMKQAVSSCLVPPAKYRVAASQFDRGAVIGASRELIRAKKPAILAGNGVNMSGAHEELRKLAERLGIPVATSPAGKGALPEDHPLSLGVFGFGASLHAEKYLLSENVDVLLVVGTSLGEASTCGWNPGLAPGRALIQIDIDPGEISKNYPADHAILGDAGAALRELNFQVERDLRAAAELEPGPPRALAEFKKFNPRYISPEKMYSQAVPLKPQRVIKELQEVLPADTVLFVDAGTSVFWAFHYFSANKPGNFFVNTGFFSMGHGTAACIGAKLARPGQPVVALVGDGSFAMNGMEVHTAAAGGIPVVWVVLNNGGYGMIYHGEKALFGDKFTTSIFGKRLDIAGIAKGLGALAFRAQRPGEVKDRVAEALASGRPAVVEVAVDLYEAPPMGHRNNTLEKLFVKA
ncbi:MAG: thiamine pyrophosphate-binding protein [Elusimicrobia bacterium CG08_land_8_20_14_0_20_59_10]|nr:MAG: thiamine pyrophosphate-binding protein [Elusimicrobia bacterium CG08_land_8_20_14_0_20_59_10]